MFFQGDLQSGIALALQESKSVVCFVHDDSQESQQWEQEWLQGHNIPQYLESKAVSLKITSGSQEAQFLSAVYPVTSTPTIVVIHQGKVEEQLSSGISRNDFTLRLLRSLNRQLSRTQPESAPSATPSQPQQNSAASASTAAGPSTNTPNTTSDAQSNTPSNSNPRLQALLEERRKRLETDKKTKDEAEAEELQAANRRARDPQGPDKTPRRDAVNELAKRQQEAKQERARILKQLENDKIARQEREAARKSIAAEQRRQMEEDAAAEEADRTELSQSRRHCSVQIRLLDGSILRTKLYPEATIRQDIRPFIDSNRIDGPAPYSFKQVLTPLPSKSITDAEEGMGLRELGMIPSLSLVLVPRQPTSRHLSTNPVGIVQQFCVGIYRYILSLFAFLASFFGARRLQASDAGAEPASRPDSGLSSGVNKPTAGAKGIRIRTLRDRKDGEDDQQMYNGNQLNFEPRNDGDEGRNE